MNYLTTQQLIERLAGLVRNETRNQLLEFGLQPVQFEALHYLSICNHYSDTPMGVTDFLGQTKGTVSQTLKVLEKKSLLTKVSDEKDKRVTHLVVTDKGRELIDQVFPLPIIRKAEETISKANLGEINDSLIHLLSSLQKVNQLKSFGQCYTCEHNIALPNNKFLCGLTKESLNHTDLNLICREHENKITNII